MNIKRTLATMLAITMIASVFAVGPVAAISQQDCTVGQQNSQANVGNVNIDTNVNAGNIALSTPVLSPGADSDANAGQTIVDNNDDFQSQVNSAEC
jgi:hypothetical protein